MQYLLKIEFRNKLKTNEQKVMQFL